jgi:hypothetical protein
VTGLAHQSNVATGVVIDDNAYMEFSFVILLDGLDGSGSSREREVQDVTAFAWIQAYTIAPPEPEALNLNRVKARLVLE